MFGKNVLVENLKLRGKAIMKIQNFTKKLTEKLNKGVSDLKTCIDNFVLPGRSCENLDFCFPVQTS